MGLAAGLIAFLLGELGWLAGVDAGAYDLALRRRPPVARPVRVAVVLIDDVSIKQLGRWPWPWSRHAEFVRTLSERYRPAAIVFDLLFAEQDPRDQEHELARAVKEAGNVYLAAFMTEAGEAGQERVEAPWLEAEYVGGGPWEGRRFAAVRPPVKELARAAAGVGPVNVVPELDGCIRRVPLVLDYQGKPYPTLTAVVVNAMANPHGGPVRAAIGRAMDFGGYRVPIDGAGEMLVSYRSAPKDGAEERILRTRYETVLWRRLPFSDLKDKVVLVGFGAAGMADVHPTPMSPGFLGVDINAHAISGILQRSFIRQASWPARLAAVLVMGWLVSLIASAWSPAKALGAGAAVVAAAGVAAVLLLWTRGTWIGAGAPAVAALLAYSLMVVQRYRQSESQSLRVEAGVDMLAHATRVIGSVRQRGELLAEIRQQIADATEARQTNLYLRQEEDPSALRLERAPTAEGEEVSYALGEGNVGWVARHGEAHLIREVLPASAAAAELARSARFQVGSVMYAPMRVRGEVVGVIEVARGRGEPPLTAEHLAVLSALASEAAVALENVKLYEQLSGRVEIANRQLVAAYSELRQERDRVAAMVSNMADGILLTDSEMRLLFINPAGERMFGVQAEEVQGRRVGEVLPHQVLLEQLGDGPGEPQGGLPMIRVESPRQAVLSPSTVRLVGADGGRAGAVTVLTDITLLQELSEMKTEFVSLVSHELRSPLTSIMGFAQTLQGSGTSLPAEQQAEFLGIIEQESYRLLVMINDLLDVSRMDAGRPLAMKFEEVVVREVAEHVVKFQQVTTSRHTFALDFPEDGIALEADRDKLVQVLTNLVSNAAKYSPKGGTVTVGGACQGEAVVVWVADEGVGMTSEDIEGLFQRFQRADRDAIKGIRGTGLGLYLVRGLVEAHGGRIWAESTPGQGSTFRVALPRRQVKPEAV